MAIVKKEAYFNSSTGVNRIRTLIWQEDSAEPRGLFQIAHGVSEHIGRYDDFARFLAGQGFVVFGNDHIGHGKSVQDQSQLGFTAEQDGHFRFVDDMRILTNIMKKRFPGLPLILFGHSMGSFCARVYASMFYEELAGLILCGTGNVPAALDFATVSVNDLVTRFGAHTVNASLTQGMNKLSAMLIPDRETDLDWLSFDRENIERYMEDPLCGAPMSLAGIRDLVNIGILASDPGWAYSVPTYMPVMLISGAKDPIGFNGKGVLAVADKLEMTGHTTEVILYPNCRHEILNESCRRTVYGDVLKWADKYVFSGE